jgi:selenium-dependent xanthine dehydrogenase
MPKITFTLNGKPTTVSYEPGMHFLEVLRDEAGVISAKDGCAPEGTCGCCTVLVNGAPVLSCLRKPEQMEGADVVTFEGLPQDMQRVLCESFVHEGAVQCGFCIPGILVRASSMLQKNETSDRNMVKEGLSANLCRCTGWERILDGIQTAGEAWNDSKVLPRPEPRRNDYFGEQFGSKRDPALASKHHYGIGQSPSRYRGLEQAAGSKPFIDDMRLPGMLYGAPVLSAHPRAKILGIDSSAAMAMPGVARVFTAADVPGKRGTGIMIQDLPVFVAIGETTCFVGDVIAYVVADTMRHARAAAEKVVIDYQVLPPVTDPFKALDPGAPQVHAKGNVHEHPNHLETTEFARGNVDEALAKAAHVIEETFQTQAVEVAFLEPEACLALPQGKGVKVFSQHQGCVYDLKDISRILNVPIEDVEIELAASGGAFGAKEDLTIQGQTAVAAFLLQRPVKCVLTRRESTRMHPKRHPMTLKYTVGADAEGRLLAVRARIIADTGAYSSTGGKCALRAACHATGVYSVPNVDIKGTAVFTNNPVSGAMRGFGSNQAQFAMEGIMNMLAERVGLDLYDIRERNILDPGDEYCTGQIMRESVRGIRKSLEAVKEIYKSAKYAGIGCGIKSTGLGNGMTDSGHVVLKVLEGGRLEIRTGHTEMGQGIFNTALQSICEETGLSPDVMTVRWDKDPGFNCGETWASRGSALTSAAARKAGTALAEALKHSSLEQLAGQEFRGDYVCNFTTRPGTPQAKLDPTTHLTFSYATQVVILDENGKLERVVAAHDVGHAINPKSCAGQIEGGVHMGLGYALTEDFAATDGVPDSLFIRDLGILKAEDTPTIDVILVEVPDEVGGYGAKGAGEIGLVPTAGAVAGALFAYDGIRRTRLPMDDAPAAAPIVPKSRRKSSKWGKRLRSYGGEVPTDHPILR